VYEFYRNSDDCHHRSRMFQMQNGQRLVVKFKAKQAEQSLALYQTGHGLKQLIPNTNNKLMIPF
jgi:hypothetical protein